ncbi:MAG: hypothetical protein SF187_18380 [Deltaproteobacteria bacterium]|nr:hypothetical protein [Deltaproteobacteria bacterium]
MPFRKTEAEQVDEALVAAHAKWVRAERAHKGLQRLVADLVQLDDEIETQSRAEREVLLELQRLTGAGWYALFNSVLGTMDDKHEVEMAALHRAQAARAALEHKRAALQRAALDLLREAQAYDASKTKLDEALAEKERFLRRHAGDLGERVQRVIEAEQTLLESLERVDRAIRARQARGASGLELRMLSSVWREMLGRKTALQEERRALLLEGLPIDSNPS